MDELLGKLTKIVADPVLYKHYIMYLEEMKGREIRSLCTSNDPVSIHRSQGAIEILDKLLKLRDNIRNLENSRNGTA